MGVAPTLCRRAKGGFVVWPIVERRGVEICPGRPHDRVNLWVDGDLPKNRRVAEGTIKLPLENWLQVKDRKSTV